MKEINIYNKDELTLCAIKPVRDVYSDKMYLISLIEKYYSLTGALLYIDVCRPNYDVSKIVRGLGKVPAVAKTLAIDDNFFSISFMYKEKLVENDLLYILSEIWFAFEQGLFSFFTDKDVAIPPKRSSWKKIVTHSSSFVMFKGVEEDVVWVGKSNDLEW